MSKKGFKKWKQIRTKLELLNLLQMALIQQKTFHSDYSENLFT